jgi:hypothetical protein
MSFQLGQIVATPGVLRLLEECRQTPLEFIRRHATGDWGDCSKHDRAANDAALKDGSRIFSVYRTTTGKKVWVITEAEHEGKRASTCILKPDEY